MLKKKISLIFVIVMILNLASALCVTAQEAEPWTPPENIVSHGTFQEANDVLYYEGNAGVSFVDNDGANGTKGCVKISGGTGAWRTMMWNVEMQKGESYTISFWAKRGAVDESETMNVFLSWDSTGSLTTVSLGSSIPITDKWTKYTFEYTATGKNSKNEEVDLSNTRIQVRPNPGNHSWQLLMDELCITPHGDVEYDYFHKDKYENPKFYTGTGLPEPKGIEVITFLDTKNHWAEKNIELLGTAGYVEGMGDGTFAPAANVTRAEWVKMMVSIFNIKPSEYSNSFKDISADDWYAEYIQTAYDCGLLDKIFTLSGEFNPNQPITREEAAAIAWRVIEIKDYESPAKATNITDLGLVSAWAKAGIKKCLEYGVLTGYSDNTVKPQATITRAEAVSMFRRILEFENLFEVYVDGEFGSDENPGTIEAPLATVSAAKEKIKPCLEGMKNNITVYIKGGVKYKVNSPIEFTPEDSGCNGYNVIYTSYGDDKPILTSGTDYSGWQLHDGKNNIYKTFVGIGVQTRQVYINGIRARRASSEPVQKTAKGDATYQIGFLKDVSTSASEYAFWCSNDELLKLSHPEDVEFVHLSPYYQKYCRSDKIEKAEDGRVKITMSPLGYSMCVSGNYIMTNAMYCENSYELLDIPGEWFLNKHDGYLYYIPREYENPEDMTATIPGAENIIKMTGTFYNKVHNIKFKNLSFEYTGWNRITDVGYGSIGQNGDFGFRKGYEDIGLSPGAVDITNAIYVDVNDCVVRKSGSSGIKLSGAIQYCNVIGNEVYDVSANGIILGDPREDELTTRLPENFAYETTDVNIINNYVHDMGKDYITSGAISFSWPKNTLVAHNEITNGPYSGMHLGWGFAKYEKIGTNIINTSVEKNYIHDVGDSSAHDGANIYTLGATGYVNGYERAKVQNNYFANKGTLYSYIYTDEGSLGWEVTGNVIDNKDNYSMKNSLSGMDNWMFMWTGTIMDNYVHDNYTTLEKGKFAAPKNIVENNYVYEDGNWPEVAQEIKKEAGLEPEYLKKFPCGVQRLRLRMGDQSINYMDIGDTLQIKFEAYGRKEEKIPLRNDEIYYYSSDESLATVDKNGLITAHAKGECNIYVTYVEGDIERQKKIELVIGADVVEITPSDKDVYLIKGQTKQLEVTGKTQYDQIVDIDDFEYKIADESIATIDGNGFITAHKLGTTTMKAVYRAGGLELEMEHPVIVSEYIHDYTSEFIESCEKVQLKAGDSLFNVSNWNFGAFKSVEGDDGVQLSDKSLPVLIDQSHFGTNKLISFDLIIRDPNTWPSIALNAVSNNGNFKTNDQYMIGFKPDIIEVQRWNDGERTMIFGSDYSPYGPGIPNEQPDGSRIFNYGMRHTITLGSFDEEEGTRIILMIDGEPIFDYTDTSEGALKSGGYFGAYAFNGYFEMLPSTDKHN